MSIDVINDLALRLVADDYSEGHVPSQPGPTSTARALAIIHLAAHDAYARVTGTFPPHLGTVPAHPGGGTDADGAVAVLGAGYRAAEILYPDPDFTDAIAADRATHAGGASPALLDYGAQVADAWLAHRATDGSAEPIEDRHYPSNAP
ncbi:MAG TPA: hypothetical protein VD866_06285, partial [Urbifossiella sp.]|nr:hypothetical protein [Urbifossiella sp.]